jgi:hypothetical protein
VRDPIGRRLRHYTVIRPTSILAASVLFPVGFGSYAGRAMAADMGSALAAAMNRMDSAMSVTHNFARMMIPHHLGAIDMAKVELLYGHDRRLRRLAQEILVTQGSEVDVMRATLRNTTDQPRYGRPTLPGRRCIRLREAGHGHSNRAERVTVADRSADDLVTSVDFRPSDERYPNSALLSAAKDTSSFLMSRMRVPPSVYSTASISARMIVVP